MRLPSLAFWLVAPATLGLLQPVPAGGADPAAGNSPPPAGNSPPLVRDVTLGDDSALAGTVVDRQGRPTAGVEVVLRQTGHVAARAITADDGRFRIPRMTGGVYEASAAGGVGIYRVWQRGAAPPGAVAAVVVVCGGEVVRGQSPRTGFFRSDAFLVSAAVLGAIAIPIFISVSSRDQAPGS